MGWIDTSVAELYRFFALRFLVNLGLPQSLFKDTMPWDRFQLLTLSLHLVDPTAPRTTKDSLWKLRPAIDVLQRQFASVCVPTQRLVVEKRRWMGSAKVYRLRVGDGEGAGYAVAFHLTDGKGRKARREVLSATAAVGELMASADLFDKGYEVYTDFHFSSPRLFHFLQSKGTNAAGEVNPNRNPLPADLQATQLFQADYRSTRSGLLALHWRDKVSPIFLLSTVHTSEKVTDFESSRRERPKVFTDFLRMETSPPPFSYRNDCEVLQASTEAFFRLVDMAVGNSYAVHRMLGGKQKDDTFRMYLVKDLLQLHVGGGGASP